MVKKRLAPKLPISFSPVNEADWADGEIYQAELSDETVKITDRTLFMSCHLRNVNFKLFPEAALEFTDCLFEKCDLSNLKFSGTGFYRCIFKDCKLLGTDFTNCHLQDIQFACNLMHYANFSSSRLK